MKSNRLKQSIISQEDDVETSMSTLNIVDVIHVDSSVVKMLPTTKV